MNMKTKELNHVQRDIMTIYEEKEEKINLDATIYGTNVYQYLKTDPSNSSIHNA